MLLFDLVQIPIDNQLKYTNKFSFNLKASSIVVLETRSLHVSHKIADLSSLNFFQYSGKIKLFDKDIKFLRHNERENYKNKISIGGGKNILFHNMSIVNNIVLPLRIKSMSEKALNMRFEELILWLNLKNIIYKEVRNLNEDEIHLLQIIRGIITNPKLLILIKPFSINSNYNQTILKLINGLISYKTSILILDNFDYNYQGILKKAEIIKLYSSV